jgi:hypothetical protein
VPLRTEVHGLVDLRPVHDLVPPLGEDALAAEDQVACGDQVIAHLLPQDHARAVVHLEPRGGHGGRDGRLNGAAPVGHLTGEVLAALAFQPVQAFLEEIAHCRSATGSCGVNLLYRERAASRWLTDSLRRRLRDYRPVGAPCATTYAS